MEKSQPPRGSTASSAAALGRRFGRFELVSLLGRSERTMLWLANDPRTGQQMLLAMPRAQPRESAALEAWLDEARRAARLAHPQLAHPVDVGSHEHWPYIAYDRAQGQTLPEWIAAHGAFSPSDAARCTVQLLQALAFVHDARFAHHDVQPYLVLVGENGQPRLIGLGVAAPAQAIDDATLTALGRSLSVNPDHLRQQREAAERDVLAAGLVLHGLLAGAAPLDEPDLGRVIDRIAPHGREILRLPRLTVQPVPEPLRMIVNRGTSQQPRLRYRSARTLEHALEGWRRAHEQESGGPVALLIERLASVGHLPAMPGVGTRAARLATMERGRTHEMAELLLQDMALSFELLRNVNSAQVQGSQASGNGPVLTVRRAIAMLGLKGVRNAAAALRAWPGPLHETAAAELLALMERVRLAGHVAQAIRPAGFDPEVIFLIAVMQNLGRLVVQYHFADEAQQVRALMRPAPSEKPGEPELPGLSEEAASTAVLGANIEEFGSAVARHWGLPPEVLHMIRRLSPQTPVRSADRDDDLLRATASCANEAVDVLGLPGPRQAAAIEHVAQRYARLLSITGRDLQEALQLGRRQASNAMRMLAEPPVLNDEPTIPLPSEGGEPPTPESA
jgi:non-specific serine/threonine protein kinase